MISFVVFSLLFLKGLLKCRNLDTPRLNCCCYRDKKIEISWSYYVTNQTSDFSFCTPVKGVPESVKGDLAVGVVKLLYHVIR